jgi:hypothetical protein
MIKVAGMSGRFWGEAVQTAVYLLNRSPTRCLKGKTPYEAWFGKKPIVRHLKVFGCVAFVKVTRPHLSKLDARGLKTVFIGYEEGSKAYRLYDPVANRVHISRDVVFDEGVFWDWEESRTGTRATSSHSQWSTLSPSPCREEQGQATTSDHSMRQERRH